MSSEKKDTRTKILEATWNLLEGGKGAAVSMSDIAKKVGVSRQAVYLHFPSRAELLTETTHYIDVINKVDQRLVASRTATSGVARLEAFIEAAGNYIPLTYTIKEAVDVLTSLIAIRNWEYYRVTCGWSQKRYVDGLKAQAKAILVSAP